MEFEKLAQEKTEMQRHYVMVGCSLLLLKWAKQEMPNQFCE